MANKFMMAVECPVCGEVIKSDGWTVDFTNSEGVVLLDLFADEVFECKCCGTTVYTGDVDCMYEYEEGSLREDECQEDDD